MALHSHADVPLSNYSLTHPFIKCGGKVNIVGIAAAQRRTVCPVRSNMCSSKWSEHITALFDGVNPSLLMLISYRLTS